MSLDKALAGRRIKLKYTTDSYTKLQEGDLGTIKWERLDDLWGDDVIGVNWDSGSTLSLIRGRDGFIILPEGEEGGMMTIDEFEDGVEQLNHDKFWDSITDTIHIGARVKVIDQDITGTVVRYDVGNKIVVLDDNRDEWRFDIEPEGEEGVLIYHQSEVEEINGN